MVDEYEPTKDHIELYMTLKERINKILDEEEGKEHADYLRRLDEVREKFRNLYRHKVNGVTVLFIDSSINPRVGMVVEKGHCECFPIGHVRMDWNRDEFEPLSEGALGMTWEVSK